MPDVEPPHAEPRHVPRSFSDVDAGGEEERQAQVLALDAMAQNPGIRRLKAWALERLDARPGLTAVDVGCGTGEDAQALAVLVAPAGQAYGVDASEVMLEEARRRAAAARSPVQWLRARADALPLDDASVDLVRCERLLQHVPDAQACVHEMARVLRPGGRVVLVDTDWRTLACWPGSRHVVDALRDAWLASSVNPAAGSQLPDLLLRAGLVDPLVTAEAVLMRPADAADRPPLTVMRANAVSSGALSQADADAWSAGVRDASARGAFLATFVMVGAAARLPG